MLDLSAAFDTIDHDILLSRLCNVYGITGNAVDWFRSYLTGRIQRVVIENAVFGDQELGFGVQQGSVLGPKIYCMYTKPVSDIIQRYGLSHHSYADDTQLYMKMDHSNNNWRDGLARIQLCVSEIREWMNQNMLKLRLQTTQPTSGGDVTVVSSCCANCVEPPRPQQWGPDLPFFGHAGHADPLDGWRCCSQKRVMSRPIQVRQL